SFLVRGGADVVRAFIDLVQKYPDVRLIILSTLPGSIYGHGFSDFVRRIPGVHVLDHRVTDDELVELMLSADVFLLPSAGLHAMSILRAMYCGLAVVLSDAPGGEEFITPGETGIVAAGRLGKTAWYDEMGLLRQTFAPLLSRDVDPTMAGNLL